MKNKFLQQLKRFQPRGMQSTIMVAFSVISISIMLLIGIVLYIRFSAWNRQESIRAAEKMMEQTAEALEDYLVSMRQISDTVYYNVIKEESFPDNERNIQSGMNLLYEGNDDGIRSIAIYNSSGSLMAAEPIAQQKEDPNVTDQDWFRQAIEEMENMHFSAPHIQNLFDDGTMRYYWVISLSRAVELTDGGESQLGVLLVDMDYSGIFRMMMRINESNSGQYYYLCDNTGNIIFHPRQIQISEENGMENNEEITQYKDGIYNDVLDGENRKIIVNTISYTGWKLVGVLPYSAMTDGMLNIRYFIVLLMLLVAMTLAVINRVVSVGIARPILNLNESVRKYEAGGTPEIYIGGTPEIIHLGQSIQSSYEQIDRLMKKIVLEQNERRKSELDVLQSQINPHFLYNTLESITWMIEGERNDEAVFMISQLAKLFRISLSKGNTVITVKDELQHAQSYMNIQKVRYKNAFSVEFDIDPEINSCCMVKLVLQPILENAINYGVSGMEDHGEIIVRGWLKSGKVFLSVEDSGIGMTEEQVHLLLTDSSRVHKHGSGVGLVNVNNRIRLLFGKEYGVTVVSEPDEGTTVTICVPAVPYTEDNRKILERGYGFGGEEMVEGNNNEE